MKRIFIILSVVALVSCNHGTLKSDKDGHLYDDDGITVIDLHGDWYQMGRQYGILAKDKIEDILSYLDGKLSGDSEKEAAAGITDSLFSIYPDYLKDFFEGVSQTSGLSIERLKLCNAVEYAEGTFHCSALAVWDDFGEGKLVFGRNYDAVSYSEIDRDLVVTVYHPTGRMAAATIGYAGELYCVNGFNENGIFLELNNGMPSAGNKIHWELCPSTTYLFDLLFDARDLDDVDDFFANTRSFASFIIGVADSNEARSYEWCYDGVKRGDEMTEPGLMVATNHYVHDTWAFRVPSDEESWMSITRRCGLLDRGRKFKGAIGVEKMKEIMSTPLEEGGPFNANTRYQIVAVPEDLTLHVNFPYNGKWAEIDMKEYF